MKNITILLAMLCLGTQALAQPNDCNEAVPGCTMPQFPIAPNNPSTNVVDFGVGTFSNPSTNPNNVPGNTGCLLTGETSSTFITINIVSSGTLAWSIQGPIGGCFDWIMWPYVNASLTCTQISSGTTAPVSCNWNSPCQGFTGMANPANLPAGGNQGNFESELNVIAGEQYLLCLSNFSGTSQNVNLNFFGTAGVACGVSAPDQTICHGGSATVNIATPGLVNPIFTWLNTAGVSNPASGSNVTVTPSSTTTYQVQVVQPAAAGQLSIIDTATFTVFVETPPTPNAGLDDTVCFGQSIVLDGSVSDLSNFRSWSYFNVGISPSPQVNFSPNFSVLQPTINVSRPGQYGFVLKETSPVCGVTRDTVYVYSKIVEVDAVGTAPTCDEVQDGQIQISTQGTQFTIDNGMTWSPSSSFNGLSAGNYTVCIQDQFACSACDSLVVPAGSKIGMNAGADTSICQNGTAMLSAVASSNANMTFYWDGQAQSSSMAITPVASKYYAVYAQTDNGCTSDEDSVFVEVKSAIELFVNDVSSVCPGEEVIVRVNPNGGWGANYTFNWSDGSVTSGSTGTLVLNPMHSTSVTISVEDACESDVISQDIEIEVNPVPEASLSFDVLEACEPAVFNWSIETPRESFTKSFLSITNDSPIENKSVGSTSALMAGNYGAFLLLTNEFGCMDSLALSNALTVHKLPVARFTSSPSNPTSVNPEVQFVNMSVDATSYQWFVEDEWFSDEANPDFKFAQDQSGAYEVVLEAYTDFGCYDEFIHVVKVLPDANVYIPNAFTPDNDDFNQSWKIQAQGIDEDQFALTVYNRWGQMMWKTQDIKESWDGTFKGKNVPTGIYTYVVKTVNQTSGEPLTYQGTINLLR